MPAPDSTARPRRALPWAVTALLALVLVLTAGTVFGPPLGVRGTAPSPQKYVEEALGHLDRGYHASGPEWAAARDRARAATSRATTYEETWPALRAAITVAGGAPSRLETPTNHPGAVAAPNPDDRPARDPVGGHTQSPTNPGDTAQAVAQAPMPTARTENGITVHTLPPVPADAPPYNQKYADQLASNINVTRAQTTCGTVIDLRGTRSTVSDDLYPLLSGLAPLLPDATLAGYVDREGHLTWLGVDGGAVARDGAHTFATYVTHEKMPGPVAVLQGPDTSGAAELAAQTLISARGARSFGEPTAGRREILTPHRLHDGTNLRLVTHLITDAAGTPQTGPLAPQAPATADAAVAHARAWLQTQCG